MNLKLSKQQAEGVLLIKTLWLYWKWNPHWVMRPRPKAGLIQLLRVISCPMRLLSAPLSAKLRSVYRQKPDFI